MSSHGGDSDESREGLGWWREQVGSDEGEEGATRCGASGSVGADADGAFAIVDVDVVADVRREVAETLVDVVLLHPQRLGRRRR